MPPCTAGWLSFLYELRADPSVLGNSVAGSPIREHAASDGSAAVTSPSDSVAVAIVRDDDMAVGRLDDDAPVRRTKTAYRLA
jgi:hypothetical protein